MVGAIKRSSLAVVTVQVLVGVRTIGPTPTGVTLHVISPTRTMVMGVDRAILLAVVAEGVVVFLATRPLHSRNERTCQPLPVALYLSLFVPRVVQDVSIPVGGCLVHFLQFWSQKIIEQWALQVVYKGYMIEFRGQPPPLRKTPIYTMILHDTSRMCYRRK